MLTYCLTELLSLLLSLFVSGEMSLKSLDVFIHSVLLGHFALVSEHQVLNCVHILKIRDSLSHNSLLLSLDRIQTFHGLS